MNPLNTYNDFSMGNSSNPFPGLRPFGIEESHLFFGRDGQSEEVLYFLAKHKFVAILGASGGGKSSLVFCGLIPILHGGFITPTGSSWHIIITRPGNMPVDNLAVALTKSASDDGGDDYFNQAITASVLRSSSMGLVDAVKQLYKINKNILIIVDQFEELFRFRKRSDIGDSINEAYFYVKLLVEATAQCEVPIYIAITMRSDFIGECSQYQELANLINKSHYLIPQMTRDDLQEAIIGPVAVAGGNISSHLIHQLLNDIGDNQDQLPIIQHALMRTWDYWEKHRVSDEPIGLNHYYAVGGIEKALSEHANEAYNELTPRGKEICATIFKTLTEKGADNRGIRRPTKIKDLASIAQASEEEIIEVIEKFRSAGRSFLAPPAKFYLNSDTIIDVSHESLMRIWDKLKIWVEEEAASVQMYQRLSESAALFQAGKASLWRPPDLHLAVNWKIKQQPTVHWAQRYSQSFERTMAYLDASQKAYEAEEQNKIRLQKKALKRSRVFALILGSAAVLSLGFMLYSQILRVESEKQKLEAIKQKKIAEWQKLLAEFEKENAKTENLKATQKSKEARIEQIQADEARSLAVNAKMIADLEKEKAINYANQVTYQKMLADSSAFVAYSQKIAADNSALAAQKARNRAYELRMTSIAQSMAIKSQQLNRDVQEKALVAFQAYMFNTKYRGLTFNPDIHKGLWLAYKAMKIKGFNSLAGHSASVRSIAMLPSGNNFYSSGNDGRVLAWSLSDSLVKRKIFQGTGFITNLIVSKNSKYMACVSGNNILVFDLQSPDDKPIVLKGHTQQIWSIAFSPDCNYIFSSADDKTLYSWLISTGEGRIFTKTKNTVKSLVVTPDGKSVIGGTNGGEICFWNRYSKDSILMFNDANNAVSQISISNDGSMLASLDKSGIKIWNVSFKKQVATLIGHSSKVSEIKFSPNNSFLASAGFDGTVRVWNTDNFNLQPFVFQDEDNSWVWSLAFTIDENQIIVGLKNNKIIKWPLNTKLLAANLYPYINRNMSIDEWNMYVAKDIKYERTMPDKPMGKGVTAENTSGSKEDPVSSYIFKVQFAVSKKNIPAKPENFNGMEGVEVIKEGDSYKYLIGNMKSLEEALRFQRYVQSFGYKETFCVAVKNGKIVPLSEAKNN